MINFISSMLLYVDPSAVSIIITSITAIVAAVGATAIVLWRKAKKKVGKVLNIDPNANKEVEEEIVITESDEAND
mgnify:CR=1 FL=1